MMFLKMTAETKFQHISCVETRLLREMNINLLIKISEKYTETQNLIATNGCDNVK